MRVQIRALIWIIFKKCQRDIDFTGILACFALVANRCVTTLILINDRLGSRDILQAQRRIAMHHPTQAQIVAHARTFFRAADRMLP